MSDEYGRPPSTGGKTGPRETADVLGTGGNTSKSFPKA